MCIRDSNLYVHALGYTSAVYGTTGLEEEYDSELTTYNLSLIHI